LERAREIIAEQPFSRWWGYRLERIAKGEAVAVLPDGEHLYRPGGYIQGGAAAALADVAFWIALMTVAGEQLMALTLNLTTTYLRGARGELRSEARVIRAGRRIVYGEAHTYDSSGEEVAHHTLTYVMPHDR
jgi:uncharacterized protein (TIGR00369 family)